MCALSAMYVFMVFLRSARILYWCICVWAKVLTHTLTYTLSTHPSIRGTLGWLSKKSNIKIFPAHTCRIPMRSHWWIAQWKYIPHAHSTYGDRTTHKLGYLQHICVRVCRKFPFNVLLFLYSVLCVWPFSWSLLYKLTQNVFHTCMATAPCALEVCSAVQLLFAHTYARLHKHTIYSNDRHVS